jgi:hypothetical protein
METTYIYDNEIIFPISDYTITINDGKIILRRKKVDYLAEDYTFSKIEECYINNVKYNINRYKLIIETLYELCGDVSFIKENSTLNISLSKKTIKGFYYLPKLNISVRGVCANDAVKEICSFCSLASIHLKLIIKLECGRNIRIII